MDYPGRIIRKGETDQTVVDAIVAALVGYGYPAVGGNGFDAALVAVVKLFQSQHFDANGTLLKADGQVGPMTWGALFGVKSVAKASGIAGAALAVAISQVGVMEKPVGSNSGLEVDKYLASVGLGPGYYWCMAFVHYCFMKAASDAGVANPFPKTGGCLDAWARVKKAAPNRILAKADAIANPVLVKPGMVFILDHGGGLGHTGFVEQVSGGALQTIEGNSNPNGSSNGIGVFRLNKRKIMDGELKGFLDFTF